MAGVRFEDVDLLGALSRIVDLHTQHYKEDFDLDKELISKLAVSDRSEDKQLLWMSRPCGTYTLREREVYLEGSHENKVWRFYQEHTNDPVLAYAISLKEVRDGKIFGDLYPLNYREHVERMKKLTCPIGNVAVAFEDGNIITIPYQERRQLMNRLMPEHGAPKTMTYLPENEPELMMIDQGVVVPAADVAGLDVLAVTDNRNAVAELEQLFELMGYKDDADAACLEFTAGLHQLLDFLLAQRGGRLVHNDHFCVDENRLGDLDHLLNAHAEVAGRLGRVYVLTERRHNFLCLLVHGRVVEQIALLEPLVDKNVVRNAQQLFNIQLLINAGDARSSGLVRVLEVLLYAVYEDRSDTAENTTGVSVPSVLACIRIATGVATPTIRSTPSAWKSEIICSITLASALQLS